MRPVKQDCCITGYLRLNSFETRMPGVTRLIQHYPIRCLSLKLHFNISNGQLLMKTFFLLSFSLMIASYAFSQFQQPPDMAKIYLPVTARPGITVNPLIKPLDPMLTPGYGFQEDEIGTTFFDLQSGCTSPFNRVQRFEDGTFSVVWNLGFDTLGFSDLGTGYNFFDGTAWQDAPLSRLESVITVNPTIAPFGNGEVIVTSRVPAGALHMLTRPQRGTGNWTESDIPLPAGITGLIHPKIMTTGTNQQEFHVVAQTLPVARGGSLFLGQDGTIVYMRSLDGGQNWDINGLVLPGMDSSFYNGFWEDTYSFAFPREGKLALLVAGPWTDMFIMASEDNGQSWEKTVIWEHPVPFWNGQATDTIFCPDGSCHLAMDTGNKVHVVFGLTSYYSDGTQQYRAPFVGGVGYWNEDDPAWTGLNQYRCLNPDTLAESGALLFPLFNDIDGNGEFNVIWNFGDYGVGPVSHPQIVIDDYNGGVILTSCITENYDNGSQNYRHIWTKIFYSDCFSGPYDLSDDPIHMFDECVFPSICAGYDDIGWYFTYQLDNSPGLAYEGDSDPYQDNFINFYYLNRPLGGLCVPVVLYANPPEGGYTTGAGVVLSGTQVTVEAHCNDGWEFVSWTKQGEVVSYDSIYSFIATFSNYLTANFRLISTLPEAESGLKRVYPNPASETLHIELSDGMQGMSEIRLLNVFGEQVAGKERVCDSHISMDISNLPTGTYVLQWIPGAGTVRNYRVIIE